MAKRGAGSYLTDRNWDEEDEQEEVTIFILQHATVNNWSRIAINIYTGG